MNNSVQSINKKHSNVLSQEQLDKIQSRLIPLLNDQSIVSRLIKLISKYESLSNAEIQQMLYTKINKFSVRTQHAIKEFISRRNKIITNSEKAFSYQSDTSNQISPSSRESFSSRSDNDVSNSKYNLLKEVERLWVYPICQKEICQLLYDNNDLEVCSSRSVAIDFQQLKTSSIRALNDYIYEKSVLLDEVHKDEDLKVIFLYLSNNKVDERTVNDIYEIIHRYEKMSPNHNGLQSIQITSLKAETKRDLVKLLRPLCTVSKPNISEGSFLSKSNDEKLSMTPKSELVKSKSNPSMNAPSVDTIPYDPYDKEVLVFLRTKISESMNNGSLQETLNIIKKNENISEDDNKFQLNVKKFKDVTKRCLYEYFTKGKLTL